MQLPSYTSLLPFLLLESRCRMLQKNLWVPVNNNKVLISGFPSLIPTGTIALHQILWLLPQSVKE